MNEKEMLSMVVTKEEHKVFTQRWRKEIGYGTASTLGRDQDHNIELIYDAARKVYADYPEILKLLGLD